MKFTPAMRLLGQLHVAWGPNGWSSDERERSHIVKSDTKQLFAKRF